jgi:predicted RNA binding protein YcfA (HicA-like mRNA interferase family)
VSHLPRISGQECLKALQKVGFVLDRQRGSHMSIVREDPFKALTIPNHRELDAGMLRAIIRAAGLTVEEFRDLL